MEQRRGGVYYDLPSLRFGLALPSTGGIGRPGTYKGCTMQANNSGASNTQVSGGIQVGPNICGATACP